MATKTEIATAIAQRLTGNTGVLTWDVHEEMLKDENTSILENLYPDEVLDGNFAGGTQIISSGDSADFKYLHKVTKQGRKVVINGYFIAQRTNLNGTPICTINDSEYFISTGGGAYHYTAFKSNGESIQLNLFGNVLRTSSAVASGETFRYQITYNTLN